MLWRRCVLAGVEFETNPSMHFRVYCSAKPKRDGLTFRLEMLLIYEWQALSVALDVTLKLYIYISFHCTICWYIYMSNKIPTLSIVKSIRLGRQSSVWRILAYFWPSPCREQLWYQSTSYGFHDLQLCPVNLAWLQI